MGRKNREPEQFGTDAWVEVKEEFDIATIIFPEKISGICTHEGEKSFIIVFDSFKLDKNSSEKLEVIFCNQFKKHFEKIK